MEKVTIKDIANICNVGISTVSRALNNDPNVNAKTRERILEVARRFHYVPNNSARNLKLSETNTVALLVKGVNNPFFQGMYDLFQRELKERGFQFVLNAVLEDQDEGQVAMELVTEKRLKGVIFLGGMKTKANRLETLGVPYVFCSSAVNVNSQPDYCAVSIDDEKESGLVTDYLISKGHKKIAIITGKKSDKTTGKYRLAGYEKSLKAHGIPINKNLISYMREDLQEYSEESGYLSMKELLESGEDFTAVFVISDRTAFGAYKAIYDAGKRIPADYSVVGFDGIEYTRYMQPSLTTMEQPVETMVRSCIDLLMAQINGDHQNILKLYPATLIERDSVKKV